MVSLWALLVPLSYRCAGLPLSQFPCVYVCVCPSLSGSQTYSSGFRVLNGVGYRLSILYQFWLLLNPGSNSCHIVKVRKEQKNSLVLC